MEGGKESASRITTPRVEGYKSMPLLHKWWSISPPFVPQEWKDGWLFLLPKPSKKPDKPQNLRPLALQEGMGKAILGLVCQQARTQAHPHLVQFPQFAYMQGRGCEDAIARAIQHCNDVISMRKQYDTVPSPPKVYGGLLLSIDLQQAFDTVPRLALFDHLDAIGVAENLSTLLRAWHDGTRYHITQKFQHAAIPISWGIRQGCVAAPFLWTCFTVQMLQQLASTMGPEWLQQAITLFADDILAHGLFDTPEECHRHLRGMGSLLDILEAAGMKINLQKTEAMLTIHGRNCNALQNQCVQRTANGYFLKIPRQNSTVLVRLTSRCGYLGIQLSYGNPQSDTLQRRLQAGQLAFKRLTCWLRKKKGLSMHYRMAIWQAMVRSSMVYGTLIFGLQPSGLRRLVSTLTVMQRMVHADHSFRTGTSHDMFFQERHLEPPRAFLRRLCLNLLHRQTLRATDCNTRDILHRVNYQGPQQILDMLDLTDPPGRWLSPTNFSCPICALDFSDAAQLTKHMKQIHHILHREPQSFRYDRDAAAGPPRCAHCGASFQSWTKLQQHVSIYQWFSGSW